MHDQNSEHLRKTVYEALEIWNGDGRNFSIVVGWVKNCEHSSRKILSHPTDNKNIPIRTVY